MRRSAAPSQKCGTDCKRSKFTVPKTVTSTTRNSKLPCERKISVDLTIDDHNDHKDNASDPDRKLHSTSPKIDNSSTSSCMIMIGQTLIVDRPPETTGATLIKKAISIDHDKKAALSSSKPLGELQNRTDQENAGKITGNEMESRYFGVVWCKRSNKKHKKWEGDAVLCSLSRSVTLLDMEGKEIGKASGFKIQELSSLTVGQTLAVGAKEVEIVSMISEVSFLSGECFIRGTMTPSSDSTELPKEVKISKYKVPLASGSVAAVSKELKPRFDPAAPGALVLPRPTEHLGQPTIVDVVVDPHISRLLRPHQQDGVKFLYACIMGYKNSGYHGAILADDMGLGKTVQIIALTWTLLRQNPVSHKPVVKRVLIVTPGSLVKNWSLEFKKWLGDERLMVFAVCSERKAQEFHNSRVCPVMIVSYEMFVRYSEVIRQTSFDLVVCDEGHRLKNKNIKTAALMQDVECKRRIVVTGTPIQNDLLEFFTLADFCNPGILGSSSAFRKIYEEPILASKQPTCSAEERLIGEERMKHLHQLTSSFILRRMNEINQKYLPPKAEYVLFCEPTHSQVQSYRRLLDFHGTNALFSSSRDGCAHLQWIGDLKKICNYPPLVGSRDSQTGQDVGNSPLVPSSAGACLDPDSQLDISLSGKLIVLKQLLTSLGNSKSPDRSTVEKMVIVSNHTKPLNIIEKLCAQCGHRFLRLDGHTPVQKRQSIVDQFNSKHSSEAIFLLSSKAGGVGLNLIGGSHLVLFDIDWNPANDLQAMARIWRDGQKKKVFIYRLLTTGTIEEKIFQRQIVKQSLGDSIVESHKENLAQFSRDDLRDLFSLNTGTQCDTHDKMECTCLEVPSQGKCNPNTVKMRSLQLSQNMSELYSWEHLPPGSIKEFIKDGLLQDVAENLSFVFSSRSCL